MATDIQRGTGLNRTPHPHRRRHSRPDGRAGRPIRRRHWRRPVLIVLAGVLALLSGLGLRRSTPDTSSQSNFDAVAVFGGVERAITSSRFTSGQATAMFRGVEIDLRSAQVEQKPAILSATALFGGVGIKVDSTWVVQNNISAILGGAEDSRKNRPPVRDGPPDLIVRGTAIFGGVEIKD